MVTPDYEKQHREYLARLEQRILAIYEAAAQEAAAIAMMVGEVGEKVFSFDDYPITKERVEALLNELHDNIETTVVSGVESQWTLANNKNNELCNRVFGDSLAFLSLQQQRRYFNNNESARDAFLSRKVNGLNLSDRVWHYTDLYRREIELALDVTLRTGTSADELSRELRSYLRNPAKLFRRVRDEHGNLILSKNAKAFHPGQGVYRSSYMNARRLAATETNIAYRTADYERYQDLDFVVGIEVHLSKNHNCKGVPVGEFYDICDTLAGKYPKTFKFTGWHPHCRCFVTSILKSDKEIEEDNERIMQGLEPKGSSENTVPDVPQAFKDWADENKERAKGWSSLPYFIKDNPKYARDFRVNTYSDAERKFTRARHTKPAMEHVTQFLQNKYPDIPTTEKAAIFEYTRGDVSDFRKLNKQLREGNLSEFNAAFSSLISSGLSKLPMEKTSSFRTVRLNKTKLTEYISMAEKGKEVTFYSYTSSSKSLSVIEKMIKGKSKRKKNNETDVLFVIKGKTGRTISALSQYDGVPGRKSQYELLFDKSTRFRLERYEQDESGRFIFYLLEP